MSLLRALAAALLALTMGVSALDQPALESALQKAPRAELPFVASRLVRAAPANERSATRQFVFAWLRAHRPALADAVIPAENRPPATPGNTNGNRPLVPPGLVNRYASP